MAEEFTATVREMSDALVLTLHGNVDRDTCAAVDAAYELIGTNQQLVLDFSQTEYINSSGIALIVASGGQADSTGRKWLSWTWRSEGRSSPPASSCSTPTTRRSRS